MENDTQEAPSQREFIDYTTSMITDEDSLGHHNKSMSFFGYFCTRLPNKIDNSVADETKNARPVTTRF